MEDKKILDLSNLTNEHFESVQKAVYQCMGSGEPGGFAFVTHKECEQTIGLLRKGFADTFCKGMIVGAVALAAGGCIGYVIDKAVQHVKDKKLVKQAEKL